MNGVGENASIGCGTKAIFEVKLRERIGSVLPVQIWLCGCKHEESKELT